MKIWKLKIELKWYIVKYIRYNTMHWWSKSFKSYLTDFKLPNTRGKCDITGFDGGIYAISWDYQKCHRKLFDFETASNIFSYLLYTVGNSYANIIKMEPYYKFSWE